MADLFRSATLLKLRPPAASWTSFFAASFSFFRDSSKSICDDKTETMLRTSLQQWMDQASPVVKRPSHLALKP